MKNQYVVEISDFNILYQAAKCGECVKAATCPHNINTRLDAPARLDWRIPTDLAQQVHRAISPHSPECP